MHAWSMVAQKAHWIYSYCVVEVFNSQYTFQEGIRLRGLHAGLEKKRIKKKAQWSMIFLYRWFWPHDHCCTNVNCFPDNWAYSTMVY